MKCAFGAGFRKLARMSVPTGLSHRSMNSLRMASCIAPVRTTLKLKEWTIQDQTPASMVFSAICLLPTMEEGAHLLGIMASSPAISEEEEDDGVMTTL